MVSRNRRPHFSSPQASMLFALGLGFVILGLSVAVTRWIQRRAEIRLKYGEEGLKTFAIQGQTAPDFSLISLDGEEYRLSDLKGTGVVLNFWATWCPPCKAEMPLLEAAAQDSQGEILFLAINFRENEELVRDFAEEMGGFEYLILLLDPPGEVSRLYNVQALPTTFFVDAKGKVRAVHIGALDAQLLTGYLEKIRP